MILLNNRKKVDIDLFLEINTSSEIEPMYLLIVEVGGQKGMSLSLELDHNGYQLLRIAGIPERSV